MGGVEIRNVSQKTISASGNVVGPGVAVDSDIAVFDGTTGKLIKDGGQTIAQVITAAVAAAVAAIAAFVQSAQTKITSGDITTTSTAFVDLTGVTVTVTTGAHRCLVILNLSAFITGLQGTISMTLLIDGANQGGTNGLTEFSQAVGLADNLSISFWTPVLSAAAHTFKVQWKVSAGATGTMFASATIPAIITVIETGLTV